MKLKLLLVFVASLLMGAPLPGISPNPETGLDPQDTTGGGRKEQRGRRLSASAKPATAAGASASGTASSSCPGTAKFPDRLTWDAECKPESPFFVKTKCLYVSDLLLHGSVKDDAGNVVVVVSNAKHPGQHPLFLQENDELFNAKVEKIAAEAITFCEYSDIGGSKNPHEVTVAIPAGSLKPTVANNKQPRPTAGGNPASLPAESASAVQVKPLTPEPGAKVLGGCTSGRYSGSKFDFHLTDVDVATFLRLMHSTAGLNYIRDQGVKGTVSLEANSMPWDQAF